MNDKLIPFLKSMWENTISPTVKNAWSKNKQNTDDIIRAIKEKENSEEVSVNNLDELVNPIVEAQNATTEAIKQIKGTDERKEVEVSLKGVSVVAIKGDTGEKGKDGKDGQDGYTPKKFKDYFTKDEIDQIIKKVQKSIRIPKDGEDGYTPIAGVNYPSYDQIKKQIEELVALFPTPKDGFTPDHEWNEEKTQIRFKNADGEWGEWSAVLKGENGKTFNYGGGGVKEFLGLLDVPNSYRGQAGKFIKVKSTENGLEFGSGDGIGDTLSPATNTDSYIPQWNGADSKTLKNGLAVPVGGLAGLTALGEKVDKSGSLTQLTTRSHADLQNLTTDDHSQYALLAGRTGGQTLIGKFQIKGAGTGTGVSLLTQDSSGATTFQVQDNGAITAPALNRVGFSAFNSNTSMLAATTTVAVFATEQEDTHGAFDGSAFTVPTGKGGLYQINAVYSFTATRDGGRYIVAVSKNSTSELTYMIGRGVSGGTALCGAGGSVIVNLAAGDVIRLVVFNEIATTGYNAVPGYCSFSATKLIN